MKTKLNDLTIFSGLVTGTDISDSKSIYDYIRINLAEVRVGPGGDYLTIGSAVAAGEQAIVLIGNTTETADIPVAINLSIRGLDKNFTIDMGTFQFQFDITVERVMITNFLTIRYADGSPIATPTGGIRASIYLNNMVIRNESTSAGYEFVDGNAGVKLYITDVKFYMPNFSTSGLTSLWAYCPIYGNGFTIVGGGSESGFYGILVSSGSYLNDVIVEGTFKQSTNGDSTHLFLGDNINGFTSKSVGLHIACNYIASNVYMTGADSLIHVSDTIGIAIENFNINGRVYIKQVTTNLFISNGKCKLLQSAVQPTKKVNVTNVELDFDAPVTNNYGDNMVFTNCIFNDSYTIKGDNMIFDKCFFGDTNGGTKTLTINSPSDNTKILFCTSESAIVDNGTNTQSLMNDLF